MTAFPALLLCALAWFGGYLHGRLSVKWEQRRRRAMSGNSISSFRKPPGGAG